MSQKTTNLELNIEYETSEKNSAWLDGMDENFETIDDIIGGFFNSVNDANIRMSTLVDLSSITTLEQTIPSNNKNMSCCVIDKYVYLIGGENTPTSVYKFDSYAKTITNLGNILPIECYSSSCFSIGKKIYITAINSGVDGTYTNISDNIIEYNIETNEINILDLKLPYTLAYSNGFVIDNIIYLVGGKTSNNEEETKILRFNPSAMTILNLGNLLPYSLSEFTVGTVNKKGYIFGGKSQGIANSKILEFDPLTSTVIELNVELPNALYGLNGIIINSNIYVLGGTNGSIYSNKIYKFDTIEKSITELSLALPYGLAKSCATYCVASGYVFGGTNGSGLKNNIIKYIE